MAKFEEFTEYQKLYAKKHHIPAHVVRATPQFELAAFLENLVRTHTLSLPNARRMYVKEYPETNHLNVPKTVIDLVDNTYYHDTRYAKTSVLDLIQPYQDSIREVQNIE